MCYEGPGIQYVYVWATVTSAPAADKFRKIDDNNSVSFKYHEPFENHFLYRHAVDDHSNNRHSDICLEETWMTHRWENRVFAFILAITKLNTWLALGTLFGPVPAMKTSLQPS
jgi:hypothetical protein